MTLGLAPTIRVGVALGRRGILGSQTPGPHLSLAELQGQEALRLSLGYNRPCQKALTPPQCFRL